MKSHVLTLAGVLLLSACGGIGSSNLNPFNWFGGQNEPEPFLPAEAVVQTDPRPLVQDAVSVTISQTPGGAILHARGVTPQAGWHSADLVLDTARSGNGVLAFGFRAAEPAAPSRGTGNARTLTAATFLSDGDLAGIREIQVYTATTIRRLRR